MGNDIPLQDREIRLLFLLHNDCGAEDIKYTLLRTTIDRAPPYEALSYAWGEDRSTVLQTNVGFAGDYCCENGISDVEPVPHAFRNSHGGL
jgi:hypothetical protein